MNDDDEDENDDRRDASTDPPGVPLSGDGSDLLPTGVAGLDRALDGGLPPGDLVAVVAPPTSQSERLLYAAAAANPARYLSTLRPPVEVHEAMAAVGVGPATGATGEESLDVREVSGDGLLDDPTTHLAELDARSVVVVDPATELERAGEDRYREFLSVLKRHLRATESVGLFHCLRAAPRPLRRDLTLARADVTFEVSRESSEDGTETHLTAGKHRRGRAPTERFRLSFADGAAVRTTRDG